MECIFKWVVLVFFSAMIFFSCDKKSGAELKEKLTEIDFENHKTQNLFPWDTLIEEVKVIRLETSKESLLNTINKLKIANNHIYILDLRQKNVFIFDVDGSFVTKMIIGWGPGEIPECKDFIVDDNQNIQILSYNSIYSFDPEGKFLSKVNFEVKGYNPIQFARAGNESYYLWNGSFRLVTSNDKNSFRMGRTNNRLDRVIEEYFEVDRAALETMRFNNIDGRYSFAPYLANDTIYTINTKEDKVYSSYFVNFEGDALSQNKSFISDKSEGEIMFEMRDKGYCGAIRDVFENDDYLFFSYFCDIGYQVVFNKENQMAINGVGYYSDYPIKSHQVYDLYDDNKIVFALNVSDMDLNSSRNKSIPSYQKQIIKLSANASDYDNPIVCVAKLKRL